MPDHTPATSDLAAPPAPFRADHVGSLLRPPLLRDALAKTFAGRGSEQDEAAVKVLANKFVREIIEFQESIGLKVVTDGEFRHSSFHNFLEKIDGVVASWREEADPGVSTSFEPQGGKDKAFRPRIYTITAPIRHSRPIEVDAFSYLKSISQVTPKVTMASPTMLLRADREQVSREAYPDMAAFYADIPKVYQAEIKDLADAGCRYMQIDETNLGYMCDPNMRSRVAIGGRDPDETMRLAVDLINAAIAKRPAGMKACIHICRGNSSGQFAAQGSYEPIAEIVLNQLDVDGYFLEYDDERSGSFEPLRFYPKGSGKRVVLGLVSTKTTQIENKDELKRRIDAASKYIPIENLCLSPQCGFASGYRGNPLTEDVQRCKLTLVAETAREVWGDTA